MPPLEPMGGAVRYFVRTEFRMDRVFPHLLEPKDGKFVDHARSRIRRADGTADRVEIVIHLPESLAPIATRNAPEGDVQAAPMSAQELLALRRRGHFEVHGWVARDVANKSLVALEIERTTRPF